MWITGDVDLPDGLIDAHRRGKLILFVGAGASWDPPSGLPLFDRLAKRIADDAGVTYDDKVTPDAFLDGLEKQFDVPVRNRTAEIISRPDSKPNPLHHAIVQLAAAAQPVRIVTTNFDNHLAIAAKEDDVDISNLYCAPALPLGRKFTGLVHLHGRVLNGIEDLVLTDTDFGQAYLTDAWAARFLQTMYLEFAVLFIGYSHDDVVMKYLAKGLTRPQNRYALTSQPDESKWRPLGITPIAYPAVGTDHSALADALIAWRNRSRRGPLAQRESIREIVGSNRPQTPLEEDYLRELVTQENGAKFFTEFAKGDSWLAWIEEQEVFRNNFRLASLPVSSETLGRWFAETYVASPETHSLALSVIQRQGNTLNGRFLHRIVLALEASAQQHPDAFLRWVGILAPLLASNPHADTATYFLLHTCAQSQHVEATFLLLGHVLSPRLRLRPALTLTHAEAAEPPLPSTELVWSQSEDMMDRIWCDLLSPRIGQVAYRVLDLFGAALEAAYSISTAYAAGITDFDAISFGRSAIEPHDQNTNRDVMDILIDGLRDSLVALDVAHNNSHELERWWRSPYAIFRRIVVHVVGATNHRSADEKLLWVLDEGLLFDYHLKHEVYILIANALPGSGSDVQRKLLLATLSPPTNSQNPEYLSYNLLNWFLSVTPDWMDAVSARADIKNRHPDYAPRDYPEFDHYMVITQRGTKFPLTVEMFQDMVSDSPSSALTSIQSYEYSEGPFSDLRWADAVQVVSRCAAEDTDSGLRIWDALTVGDFAEIRTDLRNAVIQGWENAQISPAEWSAILARLSNIQLDSYSELAIARLLTSGIKSENHAIPDEYLGLSLNVARRLWKARAQAFRYQTSEDWLLLGLNSWPGEIASFWVLWILRVWQGNEDNWPGLSVDAKRELRVLSHGTSEVKNASRPVVGSYLYLLFSADENSAKGELFPLFRGDRSPEILDQVWQGYLHNPRVSERMLHLGFDEIVLSFLTMGYERLPIRLKYQYEGLIAGIVDFSESLRPSRPEYLDKLVLCGGEEFRVRLNHRIAEQLSDRQSAERAATWSDWAGPFLVRRFGGQPRNPTDHELAGLAAWALFAGDEFPSVVEVVLSRPVGFENHSDILSTLNESNNELIVRFPALVLKYVLHLLSNTEQVQLLSYGLKGIVQHLTAYLGKEAVQPLVETAIDKGVFDAVSWL